MQPSFEYVLDRIQSLWCAYLNEEIMCIRNCYLSCIRELLALLPSCFANDIIPEI